MFHNQRPARQGSWLPSCCKGWLLTGVFILNGPTLVSGQKTVTLKNGQSFLVNTHMNGMPMYSNNEYIEIKAIHPAFEKTEGWRRKILIWSMHIKINKDFKGKVEIGTPLNPNIKQIVPFDAKHSPAPGRVSSYFLKVLDSEHAPETWGWLNEKGESWIPFTLKMQIDSAPQSIEFTDWVVVTEKEKQATQADIQSLDEYEKIAESTKITLQDGKTYDLKLFNKSPLRYSNTIFQIDSLTPGLILKKITNDEYIPTWVIKGRYRGLPGVIVTMTSPWNRASIIKQIRINGQGEFTIQYAPRTSNPEFWDWLDTKESKWVPVRVQLESVDPIYNAEFIEWFYVDDEIRAFFDKHYSSQLKH